MKIAITSDSHDNWANLEKAVNIANETGCSTLLFGGDFNAPPGVAILEKFNGDVKFVWGNNEGERMGLTRKLDKTANIELCGDVYEGDLDGLRVFMNHYPKFAEIAAKSGDYDLCVCGHTHEYVEQKIGDTLLLNPGEIQGYLTGEATFIIFDTATREVQKVTL